MNQLSDMLAQLDALALTAIGLGVAAAGALLVGIRALASGQDTVRSRLLQPGAGGVGTVLTPATPLPAGLRAVARLVAPAGEEGMQVRRQLTRAGYRGERAVSLFLLVKLTTALVPAAALLVLGAPSPAAVDVALPLAVACCAAGFYAPNFWLHSRISNRQAEIEKTLPESMDLLVTCVEAGLGLDAALARVATETKLSAPILSQELNLAFLEIQAGMPRTEAFRRLFERTGVDDLKSLAATLAQTEMFGTSIAVALRTRAEWMRTRRMQRAEEQAATIAVKMTLPLVLFILPSLIATVMGPAIIAISQSLMPGLGGR